MKKICFKITLGLFIAIFGDQALGDQKQSYSWSRWVEHQPDEVNRAESYLVNAIGIELAKAGGAGNGRQGLHRK